MSVNIVPLLEEVLGLLQTINETKGVPEGENISDKNILQTGNSNPNKKVKSSLSNEEQKKTKEFSSIFAKTFFEMQKKFSVDTALKTSVQKITPNANRIVSGKDDNKETSKKGLLLGGLLMLLGGVGALIMGLLTDGPFKGALKILSKIGISGGIKMLIAGAKALVKSIMAPFEIVQQLMTKGKFGKLISTAISDGVEMLVSGAKNLMSKFLKFVTAPFKTLGKSMGKGIFGKLFSALKPLFGILKKIPLIGSIISIGFAISRFMSGDNIGGVIDVLSALSGLLYLTGVGAPVAFAIGLGLDLLNAFLDAKTAGATDKNAAKMDILGDMAKSIGNWIWKNALWLPVIGGFKRWGMAYDAFKGGNIMEGLKQFGLGILSFAGMGPIIMGIETLMGFFGDKEEKKDLKPNTSWFGRIKEWVKNKLKKLPAFLKTPLQWFGILDDSSESEPSMGSSEKKPKTSWLSSIKEWIKNKLKFLPAVMRKPLEWFGILDDSSESEPSMGSLGKVDTGQKIVEWFSGLWGKISTWASGLFEKITPFFELITKWFSNIVGKVKEFLGSDFMTGIIDSIKNIASSVMSIVDTIFGTIKSIVRGALAVVKGFSKLFGGGDKEAEQNANKEAEEKANKMRLNTAWQTKVNQMRLKKAKLMGLNTAEEYKNPKLMGLNTAEEYKNPNWQENTNKKKVEVVDDKRKQHVDDLVLIGREQIAILTDIRNIGMQTYKVLSNSSGSSASPIIMSNSGGGSKGKPSSSQVSLNTSRGDYASSPYAFA